MLRGLQGDIVETRIIRHHYGIDMREEWNPDVHEAPDKQRTAAANKYVSRGPSPKRQKLMSSRRIWDATEQKYLCNNVMRWFVNKVRDMRLTNPL